MPLLYTNALVRPLGSVGEHLESDSFTEKNHLLVDVANLFLVHGVKGRRRVISLEITFPSGGALHKK